MRRHSNDRARRRMPPALEILEDRSVPSAGGLLSLLGPPGGGAAQPNAPSSGQAAIVSTPVMAVNSVLTTASDAGGVLLETATQPAGDPPTASVISLDLGLSLDLPLIHADNVQVSVGLLPAAPDQPFVSFGVGGDVAVGSGAGGLVSLDPTASVSAGGPTLVSAGVGAGGQVAGVPLSIAAGGSPSSPTTTPPGIVLPPLAPGDTPVSAVPSNATTVLSVVESAVGPASPAVRPAAAFSTDPGLGGEAHAAPPAAAPSATPPMILIATVDGTQADGGGGDAMNSPTLLGLPAAAPRAADVGDAAPPPLTASGTGRVAEAPLSPEAAGLTTRFQPLGPAGLRQTLEGLAAHAASPGGWLAWLMARLRQAAPWLAALVGVGAAYELRRRRATRRGGGREMTRQPAGW